MASRNTLRKCSTGAGKRIFWILVVGLIVAAVISTSTGPRRRSSPTPPPMPQSMATLSAKRLQAHASENAILGGANAGQRELAVNRREHSEPPTPPTVPVNVVVDVPAEAEVASAPAGESGTSKPKPAVRIRVRSDAPHASKEKALADALAVARVKLAEQLAALDPPIHTLPTVEQVRTEYLRPHSVTEVQPTAGDKQAWAAANLDTNRVWVDVDVEVSDDQVRQLRSTGRVEKVGLAAAGAFVLVLGLFGFLRLDAWTKGYLTAGIGVAIGAAVLGAIALLLVA